MQQTFIRTMETIVQLRSNGTGMVIANFGIVAGFEKIMKRACQVLNDGGIIAVPTDTIYGLATRLEQAERLYELKRRNRMKPLGLFVADFDEMCKWAKTDMVTPALIDRLLPGPVTVVLKRSAALPRTFNPDTDLVGIRIPDNDFVRILCARLGVPLAQTSANLSGVESPLNIGEFEDLWPSVDLIVDAGPIKMDDFHGQLARAGSTVVDLTVAGRYRMVREGCAMEKTVSSLEQAGWKLLQEADH